MVVDFDADGPASAGSSAHGGYLFVKQALRNQFGVEEPNAVYHGVRELRSDGSRAVDGAGDGDDSGDS